MTRAKLRPASSQFSWLSVLRRSDQLLRPSERGVSFAAFQLRALVLGCIGLLVALISSRSISVSTRLPLRVRARKTDLEGPVSISACSSRFRGIRARGAPFLGGHFADNG